jgi:serine/threonine protein kinase
MFREQGEAFQEMLQLTMVGPHSNIVAVLDAGFLSNGVPAIAFERASVLTPTAADFIRKHRGAPDCIARTRRIVGDVASGLAHMHAHGVIHCDVKPSNILLSGAVNEALPNMTAKVGDLGIAEPLVQRLRDSRLKPQRLGTSAYRAPELLAD